MRTGRLSLWAFAALVMVGAAFLVTRLLGEDEKEAATSTTSDHRKATSSEDGGRRSSAGTSSDRPRSTTTSGASSTALNSTGSGRPSSTTIPSSAVPDDVPTVPPGAIPPGASLGSGPPSYSWSDDPDGQYREGEPKHVAGAYVRAVYSPDYTRDPIYRYAQEAKKLSTPQHAAKSLDYLITPGKPLTFQQAREREAGSKMKVVDVRTSTFQGPGMPPPPADQAYIMVTYSLVQTYQGEETRGPSDEIVVYLKKVGGEWLVDDTSDAY